MVRFCRRKIVSEENNSDSAASSLRVFSEFVVRTVLVSCSFSSQTFRTKFEVCTKIVRESCEINSSVVRIYLVSYESVISLLDQSSVEVRSKIVRSVVELCSESI